MNRSDLSDHFAGFLLALAILSSAIALTTPEPTEAEPSAFEANAMFGA
jgi:hypothetical protein